MKVLLDTCTFLWLVLDGKELSPKAQQLIQNPDNDVFLSSASCWEIGVKYALGRLSLPEPPARFIPAMREAHGIDSLPIDETSTLQIEKLPDLHRDPFDRILICQAISHGLTVLTPDHLIHRYPIPVEW